MKALLDAQLSHAIAELLRERGLDVEAVTTRPDIADNTSDARIMEIAATEDWAVVTDNIKDFRPIAARRLQRGQGHAGLILMPSTRRRTKAANTALADEIEQIMLDNPDGLADSERWLRQAKPRASPSPGQLSPVGPSSVSTATSTAASGFTAGPSRTFPSTSKREPWHGQSHDRSAGLNRTSQPRCVQVGETA